MNAAAEPVAVPAVAGVSQIVQRPDDGDLDARRGPIELMIDAARAAAEDAGAPALIDHVGLVAVAGGWWRYSNPGQLVADALGVGSASTMLSGVSGTSPQDMVGFACERVAAGELEAALVLGGEARWTHQRLKRADREPSWITAPGDGEPERFGRFPDEVMGEMQLLAGAAGAYALFEDRLRVAAGRSVAEQRRHIAELWEGFSEVAAANPFAWDRTPHSAAEIERADDGNRMIAFPYTKAMVANNTVDMATAVLVCSAELATRLGVRADRLVYPQVITRSRETWTLVERRNLDGSPSLAAAAHAAFELAGCTLADVAHIDLYACFPSMVQMSAAALGLADGRPLTVTGGLGFAAAPVGNAVGHSIAAMIECVRGSGGVGLVHGNGGSATKQSFGLYAPEPPQRFAHVDVQGQIDLRPRTAMPDDADGDVEIEAATVLHGRSGPDKLVAAVLDGSGRRGFAVSTDPDLMQLAETDGIAGHFAERSNGELLLT